LFERDARREAGGRSKARRGKKGGAKEHIPHYCSRISKTGMRTSGQREREKRIKKKRGEGKMIENRNSQSVLTAWNVFETSASRRGKGGQLGKGGKVEKKEDRHEAAAR